MPPTPTSPARHRHRHRPPPQLADAPPLSPAARLGYRDRASGASRS
jgi:hypothetical protein